MLIVWCCSSIGRCRGYALGAQALAYRGLGIVACRLVWRVSAVVGSADRCLALVSSVSLVSGGGAWVSEGCARGGNCGRKVATPGTSARGEGPSSELTDHDLRSVALEASAIATRGGAPSHSARHCSLTLPPSWPAYQAAVGEFRLDCARRLELSSEVFGPWAGSCVSATRSGA